ncbi:S1 family peptidase [Chengkuizengella axinellae]|uniref:S1 family peptidase n=1 Tax=Chengkuizengella axinellae TaxID=3064388 RepID=A0ABT9IXH1_9BACL|nr:S1 family peptidase [Chengkuizengella sp. 2205SS18-9]MDP5274008.1 S1 family peptidase [Chengkuizengella sp. 2205SS18-9]
MIKSHNFKLVFYILLVMAITISIVFPYSYGNQDVFAAQDNVEKEIEKNIKFREKIGLNSNYEYVESLVKNKLEHKEKFSYIFSDDEYNSINDRFAMQSDDIPKIQEYIEENLKDVYGGLYIDQKDKGIINIGFTKDITSDKKKEIKELYGDSNKIKFYKTELTEERSLSLIEEIISYKSYFENEGIDIVSISNDLKSGKIIIGIKNLEDNKTLKIFEIFDKKYLKVIEDNEEKLGEVTSKSKLRPIPGGAFIQTSGAQGCTVGFSAFDRTDSKMKLVTAGHCFLESGTTGSWYQGGTTSTYKIGTYSDHNIDGKADAGLITLTENNLTYWVYGNGDTEYINLLGIESEYIVGGVACISAGNSNDISCGTIINANKTVDFVTSGVSYTISDMAQTNYTAVYGDSGGTIFDWDKDLLGIHSGGQSAEYFTKARNVLAEFNLNLIFGGPK